MKWFRTQANDMGKIKEAIYVVLPQLMTFLGDAWIILIPFGIFVVVKILNFSVLRLKDFSIYYNWLFVLVKAH
ncbi:hypothetical protein [Spiroplasma endosymbiont of Polydrusus formosus]|uniref:hypothetical protein n=1 Tax=Spiroplasma endosymbiont of Polydrusus formosus TaxID=3139326 RepID=UPI0035B51F41